MPIKEPTQIRWNKVQTVNRSNSKKRSGAVETVPWQSTTLRHTPLRHLQLKGRNVSSCGDAVYWVKTQTVVSKYIIYCFGHSCAILRDLNYWGSMCRDIAEVCERVLTAVNTWYLTPVHWFTNVYGPSIYPSFRCISLRMATWLAKTCSTNTTLCDVRYKISQTYWNWMAKSAKWDGNRSVAVELTKLRQKCNNNNNINKY